MRQLSIPELGDQLILAEDWSFTVLNESRNQTLARLLGYKSPNSCGPLGARHYDTIHCTSCSSDGTRKNHAYKLYRPIKKTIAHTWPAGTILIVDRIYIRKGAKAFSSLTFKTNVNGKIIRFFAQLSEVNKMVVE